MDNSELHNFTHAELSLFKHCDLSMDKIELLQKSWNSEIVLHPTSEAKLSKLSEPFVREYEKKYNKKFKREEVFHSFSNCIQFISASVSLSKELIPFVTPLLLYIINLLTQ